MWLFAWLTVVDCLTSRGKLASQIVVHGSAGLEVQARNDVAAVNTNVIKTVSKALDNANRLAVVQPQLSELASTQRFTMSHQSI